MCFCLLPVTGSRFEFGFAKEGQFDNLRNQLCFCLGFCVIYFWNIKMASVSSPPG